MGMFQLSGSYGSLLPSAWSERLPPGDPTPLAVKRSLRPGSSTRLLRSASTDDACIMHVYVYVYIYIDMHIHIYTYIYIYICMYAHIQKYMYVRVYMYIYIYM